MNVSEIMFELIRSEICGKTLGDDAIESIKALMDSEHFAQLYSISKAHDVSHIVAAALKKKVMFPKDNEICAKFQKQLMLAMYRYEAINFELERICGSLEEAKIRFIPLKGSVLRKYYPEAWMRTSCDIDVLVRVEELDNAIDHLCNSLEYSLKSRGSHDVILIGKRDVHIELHFDLIEEGETDPSVVEVLSDVWSFASTAEGHEYMYELFDEMFYFYHIAHMAKHVEIGGCGIRSFLDLWILDNKLQYDAQKREELLERGGMLIFAKASRKLSNVWLSESAADGIDLCMAEYILNGGVYGTVSNRVTVQQGKRGGKFKYAMSRIFLKYDDLKIQYPILEKYRIMMPVCQLRRWFRLVFLGGFKHSVNELSLNRNADSSKVRDTAELLKKIGL